MIIDIITIFPEVYDGFLNHSILKRALQNEQVKINVHDLRDYSKNRHRTVDDTPYGGGIGMLMSFPPFHDAICQLRTPGSKVVLMSPQGKVLTQETAHQISLSIPHLIILCGHYEGVDARVLELIDFELSVGDYVLTGGEFPSMILIDSIVRLLPEVIQQQSVEEDSLQKGLLKHPQYTKPENYQGYEVPKVLLSGHHQNIENWREEMSLKETILKRPDLLKKAKLTKRQKLLLEEIKKP